MYGESEQSNLRVVKAKYNENVLPEFKGNLFIEALPAFPGIEGIKQMFTSKPEKLDRSKNETRSNLYLMVSRVKRVLIPFQHHPELAFILYTMIVVGYHQRFCGGTRNQRKNVQAINEVLEAIDKGTDSYEVLGKYRKKANTVATSFMLTGESGMGKTLTVEMISQVVPDAIIHSVYKGKNESILQIPCIKIDCPRNGKIIELCQRFLKEVDIIANTHYLEQYSLGGSSNVGRMIMQMNRVAQNHAVGIIIIDEIQNIIDSKTDVERAQTLNFLVEISNTLGVPTLFIGTPEARELLQTDRIAVMRRLITEGEKRIDRLKKEDKKWEQLISTMWEYQYLPEYYPLTQSLRNVFYKYTQGNIAQLVDLYCLVQKTALYEKKPIIDASFVSKVVKEWKPTLGILSDDIASGKRERTVNKYRDIEWDYELAEDKNKNQAKRADVLQQNYKDAIVENREQRTDIKQHLVDDMVKIGIFDLLETIDITLIAEDIVSSNPINEKYNRLKELCIQECIKENSEIQNKLQDVEQKKAERTEAKNVTKNIDKRDSLIYLYNKAKKQEKDPKEVLEEYGYIKDPVKEFLKGE